MKKEAQDKLNKAKEIISQGKIEDAIALAKETLKIDAANADAKTLLDKWKADLHGIKKHLVLIEQFLKTDSITEVERELQSAKKLHPKYPPVAEAENRLTIRKNEIMQKQAQAQRLKAEGEAFERQGNLENTLSKYKESLKILPDKALQEHVKKLEAQIAQNTQKKATADRLWDECGALAKQSKSQEALAKCRESLTYWSDDKRRNAAAQLENAVNQPPQPPTQTPQPLKPPTSTDVASRGYWRLIERKSDTKKGSDYYPVEISGTEGNLTVHMGSVCGEKGTVRVNAKWTLPPETLSPGEPLRFQTELIPTVSGTQRGIGEEIMIKFDNAEISCGFTTAGRITIIDHYNAGVGYPGDKKEGEAKVPQKGHFKPADTLKVFVCLRYYHQYYIYQWTEKQGTPTKPTPLGVPVQSSGQIIFNNGNIGGVYNNPTKPTVFTINQPHVITLIQNYHWNNAKGSTPGTIALRSQTGQTYGPWQSKGSPGQGGVPNAYWTVYPNITLPAGTYTVMDSNPATWAQNGGSQGAGFTRIEGYPAGQSSTGATSPSNQGGSASHSQLSAEIGNSGGANIHIFVEGQDTFGPHNRLVPGERKKVNLKAPAQSGYIKFVAGRNGQVLATCRWEYDSSSISGRVPVVVFSEPNRLSCTTGLR